MNAKRETILLDEPLVYEDSPNIPTEHRKKVAEHVRELDKTRLEFTRNAEACYGAKSVEELAEALEKLEPEVRKEFFFGLASVQPDMPEDAILRELYRIDATDPKKAAQWCGAIDPHYGTAYAMGWVCKQQARIAHGLPNDVQYVQQRMQLERGSQQERKQLTEQTIPDRVLGTTERVLDATRHWLSSLIAKRLAKKENSHG